MTLLCERCFASVEADDENVVRLAHIDHVRPDGAVAWTHSYVHTSGCVLPRVPRHQRPDPGAWDPSRGIQSRRP